jgi:hypothetical protein
MSMNSQIPPVFLDLCGIKISIAYDCPQGICVESRYRNFIQAIVKEPDYVIRICSELPATKSQPLKLIRVPLIVTSASGRWISTNQHYQITIFEGFTQFDIPFRDQISPIRMRVSNNPDEKCILATTAEGSKFPILPYPLDILLLYHLGQWFDLLIFHGAGFSLNDRGFLCLGRSGAGKSTLSGIVEDFAGKLIQDDRVILQKTGEGWLIHPLPLHPDNRPVHCNLDAIYCLFHGQSTNREIPLYGESKLKNSLPHLVQFPSWQNPFVNSLHLVQLLMKQISLSELFFIPNHSIIEYLKHVKARSKSHFIPLTKPLPGEIQSDWNQHGSSNIPR